MFIVIEGLDGAGKSTQVKMIREELKRRGIESEYLHFPRFDAPIFGNLVARFLRGELGDLDSVNPYLVALIYAGDRADASSLIQGWIDEGKCVIIDRYVCSNIAYQCAKIEYKVERAALREWILDTEYEKYKIVRPDLSLFLDVPFKFTKKSLSTVREGDDRAYLKGCKDIHEDSLSLQEMVRRVYIDEATIVNSGLNIIECGSPEGDMLAPDEIFARIWKEIEVIL